MKCAPETIKLQSFLHVFNYLGKFLIEMWVDLELHIPKPVWQGQKQHHEECDHGIPWWKTAALLRQRCIRSQSRGKSSASEGQNVVPRNKAPNNVVLQQIEFTKQKKNKCWNPVQQHRMRDLGIFYGLEKFHDTFPHKISMITDHKLPVVTLQVWCCNPITQLQRILLRIHQYNIIILYKPGPKVFIAD